jgi:hypothetical protein
MKLYWSSGCSSSIPSAETIAVEHQ